MIGRPASSEAAEFYFPYINQVSEADPVAVMQAQLEEAAAFLAAIPEEKSLHRYAPEKWSLRQVLNHINDTERAFAFRALCFARGFQDALPGFDQNIAAAGASADNVLWSAHIEEFRAIRKTTLALFRNLPEDAWMKTGVASGNLFTVRALAFIIPGHVAYHLRLIRERYL